MAFRLTLLLSLLAVMATILQIEIPQATCLHIHMNRLSLEDTPAIDAWMDKYEFKPAAKFDNIHNFLSNYFMEGDGELEELQDMAGEVPSIKRHLQTFNSCIENEDAESTEFTNALTQMIIGVARKITELHEKAQAPKSEPKTVTMLAGHQTAADRIRERRAAEAAGSGAAQGDIPIVYGPRAARRGSPRQRADRGSLYPNLARQLERDDGDEKDVSVGYKTAGSGFTAAVTKPENYVDFLVEKAIYHDCQTRDELNYLVHHLMYLWRVLDIRRGNFSQEDYEMQKKQSEERQRAGEVFDELKPYVDQIAQKWGSIPLADDGERELLYKHRRLLQKPSKDRVYDRELELKLLTVDLLEHLSRNNWGIKGQLPSAATDRIPAGDPKWLERGESISDSRYRRPTGSLKSFDRAMQQRINELIENRPQYQKSRTEIDMDATDEEGDPIISRRRQIEIESRLLSPWKNVMEFEQLGA